MNRFDRLSCTVTAGLILSLLSLALFASQTAHEPFEIPAMWLYLVATASEETQVWQWDKDNRTAQQFAQLPGPVWEYAHIPHSARVVYAVQRDDGGHDLWWVDLQRKRVHQWLDCAPDDCRAIAPSPDGQGIVFTRVTDNAPRLWWLACDSTDPTLLSKESTFYGDYAAWSPDGNRLAYVDPTGQVCIVNLANTADVLCVPSWLESPPAWSSDGTQLLITDMRLEKGAANHILHLDIILESGKDLSKTFGVEDDRPTWSPNGEWIAFRRRSAGTAMGKQLWLMQADGSDVHALTTDTASHYGPPVWAQDGKTLFASRHLAGQSAIWAFSVNTPTATLIVTGGYLPHRLEK